ncbi:rod shape-determining protein MreD, partial [Nonomuraea sp. SBT364]|uniref:rod shape-determining protein MreD n=1 Tax=Nonomuraea sp. SBT364 TaxID=1580530 RepID=UPI00066C29F0
MTAVLVVPLALLLQVMLVNRLPLPAGGTPDLVLLAVVAVALLRGPAAGAVIGFVTGLVVDVVPPTAHVAGLSGFGLGLVGYLAGGGAGSFT